MKNDVLGVCVFVCFGVNEWMRTVKLFVRRHVIAHALVNYAVHHSSTPSSPIRYISIFFCFHLFIWLFRLCVASTTNFLVLKLTATIVIRARDAKKKNEQNQRQSLSFRKCEHIDVDVVRCRQRRLFCM